VLAVLWDVTTDQGWLTLSQDQFDHVKLSNDTKSSVRLTFSRDAPFNAAAVEKLAWAARIEHANRSVTYARALLEEAVEMNLEDVKHFQKGVLASLDFDFGVAIAVIKPSGRFTEEFRQVISESLKSQSPDNIETATRQAMILSVFEMIRTHCAGNGAPLGLVKELCHVFYPLLFDSEVLSILSLVRHPEQAENSE
jgi:6-pyruvoyl-tetrahydropterin synthase